MAKHKIIISGVGRSGTTFLFEEIAAAIRAEGPARLFYEPYLWEPRKINESGRLKSQAFDNEAISPLGIYVHCNSPLFLDGPHEVHDLMVRHLLAEDGNVTSKMIRGNGRIQAWLNADPDLRVVAIVRDVFGTINSAQNFFSFLGEDFHPSDRTRLLTEIAARYKERPKLPKTGTAGQLALWNALWWKYMTRAALDAKRAFPERVLVIDYDSLRQAPDPAYAALDSFIGLPVSAQRKAKRVGPVSQSNYLRDVSLKSLAPFHDWLRAELGKDGLAANLNQGSAAMGSIEASAERFGDQRVGVLASYSLGLSPVRWRHEYHALERKIERVENAKNAIAHLHNDTVRQHRAALSAPALGSGAPSVSVIMPVWNAKDSLEASVASVWAQKGVRAEVVIVDDLSTDGSLDIACRLVDQGPARLIVNARNLGPGLSRHKGMLGSGCDLVSTVDADDLLYPFKLEAEVDALGDDDRRVAYSCVEYANEGQLGIWEFAGLGGLDHRGLVDRIAGRKTGIPRDMTFRRSLYERTRGFDGVLRMYEDWAFKIELATRTPHWINTGIVGMRYEHGEGSASDGTTAKHLFFRQAAFLRNADELALQLGAEVYDNMFATMQIKGERLAAVDEGIAALKARAAFAAQLFEDLHALRRAIFGQVFHEHVPYDERLSIAYTHAVGPGSAARQS